MTLLIGPRTTPLDTWNQRPSQSPTPAQARQVFDCQVEDSEDGSNCLPPPVESPDYGMRYVPGGMSYDEGIQTLRDGLKDGAFGQGPDESPYLSRQGLEGLRALDVMFSDDGMEIHQESTRAWRELFDKLDSAKRDKGLEMSDPKRLEPEDGRISIEDLNAFASDIARKRENLGGGEPYYVWEESVFYAAPNLASAWENLGFGDTIGREDIERLSGAAEAASVVQDYWYESAEQDGRMTSVEEEELDLAGPNNGPDAYSDGIFSLRDFNAYIENNRSSVAV